MSVPDPKCPQCDGSGMVPAKFEPPHPPTFERCECVLKRDVLENVERALKGLSEAPKVSESPLSDLTEKDCWVTAGDSFLGHLRHVGVRKPPTYFFKVVSDAELVTAWLGSIALNGKEILDADAYKVSTRFVTVPDLVVPPDLLVIRMGVKVARNQAASEVLAEALNIRMHEGKPTWLWDEPAHPLNAGHLFWSDAVGRILTRYKRVGLSPEGTRGKPGSRVSDNPSTSRGRKPRKTLRGGR